MPLVSGGGGARPFSGASVTYASAPTVANGAIIPFDTADYDTDTYLDAINHRLVVPHDGVYLCHLNAEVTDTGTPAGVVALINFTNPVGSGQTAQGAVKTTGGTPLWEASASGPIRCVKGNYVSAQLNTDIANLLLGGNSWFSIEWLGPLP